MKSYTYDGTDAAGNVEHRGLPTGLDVSGVGTYKAAYDADGNMTTQQLPGGITQQLGYDEQGRVSTLEYDGQVTDQDTGVVSTGSWLEFDRSYDQSGMVAQDLAPAVNGGQGARGYSYDAAGRLVTVTDAQTGGASDTPDTCTVRQYAFDSHGNRTKLTATTNDTCTTDGTATGATQTTTSYAYDAYSRQTSGANGSGAYSYDAFGRQTLIPASDAPDGSAGSISVGYDVNDQAHSIKQGGVSTAYGADPDGRRVMTTVTGSARDGVTIQHYGDDSDYPAWATNATGDATTTTAYTASIGAGLAAQVTSQIGQATSASLDLANIAGDIVATVPLPSVGNATGIDAYTPIDEYGVLQNGAAATGVNQYGWNGTSQRATGAAGLTLMGARLYNPDAGRFTSVDPVMGGNENAYNYPNDPVNSSDLNGQWCAWGWLGTTCTRYATDRYGRYIPIRYNVRSKVLNKHGITFSTLVWILANIHQSASRGTRVEYLDKIYEYLCSWTGCRKSGRYVKVVAVVDFRLSHGATYGLVTTYCLGMVVCPRWINNHR